MITRYLYSSSNYVELWIQELLTSRLIGVHTKLAQLIEKTKANTMNVQFNKLWLEHLLDINKIRRYGGDENEKSN